MNGEHMNEKEAVTTESCDPQACADPRALGV